MKRFLQSAPNVKNSESGLTLVEVMVVSGLMLVLALGMATFLKNAQDGTKAVEVKSNYNSMGSGVRSIASQPGAVNASLEVIEP